MDMKPATTNGKPSTNVHSFGYDPETKTLAVRYLKNGEAADLYHYHNVDQSHHAEMMKPDVSTGSYLHKFVKPKHKVTKI